MVFARRRQEDAQQPDTVLGGAWLLDGDGTPDLVTQTFSEVYRIDGPSLTETLQPGIDSAFDPPLSPTSVTVSDQNPPDPSSTYRFKAEYAPPGP